MSDPFPLEQWFDVTLRISDEDADLTEAQMALSAVKQDMDPAGEEAKRQYTSYRHKLTFFECLEFQRE